MPPDRAYQPGYRASWALVVGINNYRIASPLSYACNDADSVSEALTTDLGFPDSQVVRLKDDQATKQGILDCYFDLSDKACDEDDRVLVFFAGHGMTLDGTRGPVGYLVPVDGDPDKKNSLIRWDDLTRNAELFMAKHMLFILDACYSGLALQRTVAPGAQRFISDMLQRFSRQAIAAGKADETVADGGGPKGKNSIFTGHLMEGLKGAAADENGVITANGLMHYVYEKVSQDARSKQTPHYGHFDGDGDFILRTPKNEHLNLNLPTDFPIPSFEEKPESPFVIGTSTPKPAFSLRNGYGDPRHPSFGRNDWTKKLGERKHDANLNLDVQRAFSWLSLIVEPDAPNTISIDNGDQERLFSQVKDSGANPWEGFPIPSQMLTTIDSMARYEADYKSKAWMRYLRMDDRGNIEYADSWYVCFERSQWRFFKYVQLIGITWKFLYLARDLLTGYGYNQKARLLVNLVGTRDTVLSDFSLERNAEGKAWLEPLIPGNLGQTLDLDRIKCSDPNLQLEYQFLIGKLDDNEGKKIITNIAKKLGLAYNHQSEPRCFNFGTEEFPWQQFRYNR